MSTVQLICSDHYYSEAKLYGARCGNISIIHGIILENTTLVEIPMTKSLVSCWVSGLLAGCLSWCIQLEAFEIGSDMLSICCKLAWLQFLLKFCNMIKVPSHELFPNPPWSKYINKFSFNTKIWCVSNKMLCGGRNIYSQKEYWLLIGHAWSRDLDTGLWLVRIISCCAPQEPRGWLRKLI